MEWLTPSEQYLETEEAANGDAWYANASKVGRGSKSAAVVDRLPDYDRQARKKDRSGRTSGLFSEPPLPSTWRSRKTLRAQNWRGRPAGAVGLMGLEA